MATQNQTVCVFTANIYKIIKDFVKPLRADRGWWEKHIAAEREARTGRKKKILPLNSSLQWTFSVPVSLFLFLIFLAQSLCAFLLPGQALLEVVPAESRGLRIIEVVFFLITYKNRDKAKHQPCDLFQVTSPLNSPKKASISTFPTAWYFEPHASWRTIYCSGKGREAEKKYYLDALIKWRT